MIVGQYKDNDIAMISLQVVWPVHELFSLRNNCKTLPLFGCAKSLIIYEEKTKEISTILFFVLMVINGQKLK